MHARNFYAFPGADTSTDTEETPGGLLIVRAPRNHAQIPPRQPTAGHSEPPPAAKEFKADRGLSVHANGTRTASVEPVVEKDVRDMEDEADRLRRASRAHTTIDPALASTSISFRPPVARETAAEAQAKGREGARPWPLLHGIASRRRRSHSLNRTHGGAHSRDAVNDDSFYKHINPDLPDAEQLCQLFTWTASCASTSSTEEMSPEDVAGIEDITDDMVRMLTERRIDLALFGPEDDEDVAAATGTNAQNEKNRQWEVVYTKQLQDAQNEDGDWKKAKIPALLLPFASSSRSHAHSQLPDAALLSDRLLYGLQLAQAPSPSAASTQIRARLPGLQFKFDLLRANLNCARTCARVAGRVLVARFGLLAQGLVGRVEDPTHTQATAVAGPSGVGGYVTSARDGGDAARRATSAGEGERRVTLTAPPGSAGAGGSVANAADKILDWTIYCACPPADELARQQTELRSFRAVRMHTCTQRTQLMLLHDRASRGGVDGDKLLKIKYINHADQQREWTVLIDLTRCPLCGVALDGRRLERGSAGREAECEVYSICMRARAAPGTLCVGAAAVCNRTLSLDDLNTLAAPALDALARRHRAPAAPDELDTSTRAGTRERSTAGSRPGQGLTYHRLLLCPVFLRVRLEPTPGSPRP
ncbi:hypothetical protein B0H16DRAFT_1859713 [Mycena metata]|uniref:Uncharacterized protein n=1 Tax=Mycena metata TaxID=1033252 RepID=A0AAD7DG02_9AGAR|nr:hypothetical protein B0H16DRAFT_1859713 [Mycena metata]